MTQSKVLNYDDVYTLAEETQSLKGGQLQKIYGIDAHTVVLEFRTPGQTYALVLCLKPSRPWFGVDAEGSAKASRPRKVVLTPVINFLRAHFVGLEFLGIAVAQKPNRLLRLDFDSSEGIRRLYFKVFPHGCQIGLEANDKQVVQPRLKTNLWGELVNVAFVEPEPRSEFSKSQEVMSLENAPERPAAVKENKKAAKLERAIQNLQKSLDDPTYEQSINNLLDEAEALKGRGGRLGTKLQKIYGEIHTLKTKRRVSEERLGALQRELQDLPSNTEASLEKQTVAPIEKRWKGIQVSLDPEWELWVGRNAQQNDELIKAVQPHDLWIHLRDYPGAHGVIRGSKKASPPEHLIEKACLVVAQLSQRKKHPFLPGEKLDFIVTPRKFVRKKKGMAPGQVIVEREGVRRIAFKILNFTIVP
ncbi:MAG: DUF814 domain-containing protein [Oligoflexia bacterium]|nr:DUF814 domain-containing protein [Oligoflexia bacterium]